MNECRCPVSQPALLHILFLLCYGVTRMPSHWTLHTLAPPPPPPAAATLLPLCPPDCCCCCCSSLPAPSRGGHPGEEEEEEVMEEMEELAVPVCSVHTISCREGERERKNPSCISCTQHIAAFYFSQLQGDQ